MGVLERLYIIVMVIAIGIFSFKVSAIEWLSA